MLAKGSKLLFFTYRLGGSNVVSFIRGTSQSKVFKRLYKNFCSDWERNITICEYPSNKVLYDGAVGRLEY